MPAWVGAGQKIDFYVKTADFCLIVNISVKILWRHAILVIFAFLHFFIFNFLQIIMVSLFLSFHDQHFIMFKDSNIYQFTNFPFKTKYNNTVVYFVNSNCLFSKGKQEKKLLIQLCIYCAFIDILPKPFNKQIIEMSSNSLLESHFPGELRLRKF